MYRFSLPISIIFVHFIHPALVRKGTPLKTDVDLECTKQKENMSTMKLPCQTDPDTVGLLKVKVH